MKLTDTEPKRGPGRPRMENREPTYPIQVRLTRARLEALAVICGARSYTAGVSGLIDWHQEQGKGEVDDL